jgi:glycerol-3-phosphate cytidylyltransferase
MYNKIIEDFKTVGVDVVFLPHTEGVSSTMLSEYLNREYGMMDAGIV